MNEYYSEEMLENLREPLDNKEKAEEVIDEAVSEIKRLADVLNLDSSVRKTATDRYREIIDVDLSFYPSVGELTGGVIYVACRTTQIPRTRGEVARKSVIPRYSASYPLRKNGERTQMRGTARRKVDRSYRLIIESLAIDPPRIPLSNFVQEYCSRLDVSSETMEIALVIAKKMEDNVPSGYSAGAIASGIVDYSTNISNSDITQKEISNFTFFSLTTIRDCRGVVKEEL